MQRAWSESRNPQGREQVVNWHRASKDGTGTCREASLTTRAQQKSEPCVLVSIISSWGPLSNLGEGSEGDSCPWLFDSSALRASGRASETESEALLQRTAGAGVSTRMTLASGLCMLSRENEVLPGTQGCSGGMAPTGQSSEEQEDPLGASNPLVLLRLDLPSWKDARGRRLSLSGGRTWPSQEHKGWSFWTPLLKGWLCPCHACRGEGSARPHDCLGLLWHSWLRRQLLESSTDQDPVLGVTPSQPLEWTCALQAGTGYTSFSP